MKTRVWVNLALAAAVICMSGCVKKKAASKEPGAKPAAKPEAKEARLMSAHKESFGQTPDGRQVVLYTLTNTSGIRARITNYGAILVSLEVPEISSSTP